MGVFDTQIKTVKRLIDKYGEPVALKTTGSTISNPTKPWESTDSVPVSTDVKIVFLSPSASGNSMFSKELLQYLSGTSVSSGTVRGYMAPSTVIPKLADIVVRSSAELKIKAVETISPNGQILLHVLEFDR